jgi:hypothetical protein
MFIKFDGVLQVGTWKSCLGEVALANSDKPTSHRIQLVVGNKELGEPVCVHECKGGINGEYRAFFGRDNDG